jgi:hypothetical protein
MAARAGLPASAARTQASNTGRCVAPRSRLGGWRPTKQARLLLLFQAIALTLDHQRVTVMEQAVENRGRQDVVAEDGAPLRHDLIGGDDQPPAGRRPARRARHSTRPHDLPPLAAVSIRPRARLEAAEEESGPRAVHERAEALRGQSPCSSINPCCLEWRELARKIQNVGGDSFESDRATCG